MVLTHSRWSVSLTDGSVTTVDSPSLQQMVLTHSRWSVSLTDGSVTTVDSPVSTANGSTYLTADGSISGTDGSVSTADYLPDSFNNCQAFL
jgi:hypothetical protein